MPKHPDRVSVWEATPKPILDEVLHFAQIKPSDVLFDLGSGDGCVLIRASQLYGCRSVGLEITQKLIDVTRHRAKKRGVDQLVKVRNQDMKKAQYKNATIVYMFLPDGAVKKMVPILQKRCKKGTKIVTLGNDYVSGEYKVLTPYKELHLQLPNKFWKFRMYLV
jgi:precorrin-6B methylase 2